MKGSEVLKALEEGKKMRIKDWRQHEHIYKNENNEIVDEEDIGQDMLGINIFLKGEWEEYIEPEFKVGDWFVKKDEFSFNKNDNFIAEKISSIEDSEHVYYYDDCRVTNINEIRKATDEEIKQELKRRKWQSIGRNINQYEIDDIVKYRNENDEIVYGQIKLNGHTADDFIHPFNDSDKNRYSLDNIELVCSVENRFDK